MMPMNISYMTTKKMAACVRGKHPLSTTFVELQVLSERGCLYRRPARSLIGNIKHGMRRAGDTLTTRLSGPPPLTSAL